jgi:hypothetical protein
MLEWLSPAQREMCQRQECFLVTGSRGGCYLIDTTATSFNIGRLNNAGEVDARLCLTSEEMPIYDIYLAQKTLLETDEHRALRIANWAGTAHGTPYAYNPYRLANALSVSAAMFFCIGLAILIGSLLL